MVPPTVVDPPSGKTYFIPGGSTVPTQFFPGGILTDAGQWLPLRGDPMGNVYVNPVDASQMGTPYFDDAVSTTTPGEDQVLISNTVPSGKTRSLSQILVVTRVTGTFTITQNGAVIGSGRTGPAGSGPMTFIPSRTLQPGDDYEVIFTARANSSVQGVECYLQASDITS